MIHWLDGEITYRDDGQGPKAFEGGESIVDRVIRYRPSWIPPSRPGPKATRLARTPGPA